MHWVKFLPSAWLVGTRMLTDLEKSVYIDFIMLLYDRDGNLPNDDKLISRLLQRDPRTWRAAKRGLIHKDKIRLVDNSVWTANRVEFELSQAQLRLSSGSTQAEFSLKKSKNPEKSTVNAPSRARDTKHYTKKDSLSERVRAPKEKPQLQISDALLEHETRKRKQH